MAKVCVGQGGIILTDKWLAGEAEAQYLDWSESYPTGSPPTAMPNLADAPYQCADQACLDAWARGQLADAWLALYGELPSDTELQGVQAISRMLTNYGYPAWPTAITDRGRIVRGWWGHHNWGAILCSHCPDDCAGGFVDSIDLRVGDGEWKSAAACFKHEVSNERGAVDLLRLVLGNQPSDYFLAKLRQGDAYAVTTDLLGRGIFVRSATGDQTSFEHDTAVLAQRLVRHAYAAAEATGDCLRLFNDGPKVDDPTDPPGLVNEPPNLPASVLPIVALAILGLGVGYGAYRWHLSKRSG